MKNFLYDEDEFSSDENINNESYENDDDIYEMKPKNKQLKKIENNEHIFNEDIFDRKVAKSISEIHSKNKDMKLTNWVNSNLVELQKLYHLSEMSIPIEKFYIYIYKHSISF